MLVMKTSGRIRVKHFRVMAYSPGCRDVLFHNGAHQSLDDGKWNKRIVLPNARVRSTGLRKSGMGGSMASQDLILVDVAAADPDYLNRYSGF
jgi:hypothetical protein